MIIMSLTTTPTNRFGFSMMRGKFCHSTCFEIIAHTALAQFGHFTLKTDKQSSLFCRLINPIDIASPTGDCEGTIYGLQVKQPPWNLSMFDTLIRNYKLKKLIIDNAKIEKKDKHKRSLMVTFEQ